MTERALADLLAEEDGRLRVELGTQPTVEQARNALARLFDRIEGVAADPDERTAEQHAHALWLLRCCTRGVLQSVRPPDPAPERRPPFDDRDNPSLLVGLLRFGRPRAPEPVALPVHMPDPVVEPAVLDAQLTGAFEQVDRLLALAAPPEPVRVHRPWAQDKALVDLISELLEAAAARDPEHVLRIVDILRRDLPLHHGIAVVDFDGTNAQHFRIVSGDPADGPSTRRPALLDGGTLLRRGEAVVPPAATPPDDAGPGPAAPLDPALDPARAEPTPSTPQEPTVMGGDDGHVS